MAVRDKINKALIGAGGLAPGLVGGETAQQIEARKREGKKKSCEASGGTWDGTKCIKQKPKEVTPPKQNKQKGTAPKGDIIEEVVKNEQGGTAGFIDPRDGKFYSTAGAPNPRDFINRFNQNRQLPEGTITTAQASAEKERQAQLQQLIQQGQAGLASQDLSGIQEAPIDIGQAVTAGLVNALPSFAGGVAGGAILGGTVAGPIGSIGGALIGGTGGAITGILNGILSNIKTQQSGEIKAGSQTISNARKNFRNMRMVLAQDPLRANEVIPAYYEQLSQVHLAHRQVQAETSGNLNKFMEDGRDILSQFEFFLEDEAYWYGERIKEEAMRITPATPEQILQIYQEEYGNDN